MAIDAVVTLQQLRCMDLKNTESKTEPYIWPALIRVDDNTFSTSETHVDVVAPILEHARVVIKDDMQAGETARIPTSVGQLRTRFEDNLNFRRLHLIVALLESDETPQRAMRAGYMAFTSQLGIAIGERLLELRDANDEQTKEIVENITEDVEGRVRSAIKNGLTSGEKARVFFGTLNLDDTLGSNSLRLSEADETNNGRPLPDRLEARTFTLNFEVTGPEIPLIGRQFSKYEIRGRLEMRPVVIEQCQPQINGVMSAQSVVNTVESEIKRLQDQLAGKTAPDPELTKPEIHAEISRLRNEEMPVAEAALSRARQGLMFCRRRVALGVDTEAGGIKTPNP